MTKLRIIQLIAPSGKPASYDAVARAVAYFSDKGWEVHGQGAALRGFQRFAGTDAERLLEINDLVRFSDKESAKPSLVMALRGGYGLSRLLNEIDFVGLARANLHFMGHSDFTAFNLAYFALTGKSSYVGPMACFDFGSELMSNFTERHFEQLLDVGHDLIQVNVAQPYRFEARGVLWGGNLAMVNQAVGTRFLPKVEGGILFLEDINEHPYRIERSLHQLRDSGVLEAQSAVLLGQFNGYKLYDNDAGYDFNAVVDYMRSRCDVPILTDFPFGHVKDKVTLPVGQMAHLSVDGEPGYRLSIRSID